MKYYSNEIVFRGHPDKVCDQISGALLDEYLKQDKYTRAGIECVGGKGIIFITGEVTTTAKVDVESVVNIVLNDIGIKERYQIVNNIGIQSRDIALGVDKGGAGDQGMMFGYACDDTDQYLPTAMVILQELAQEYDKLVHESSDYYPDGKAQITGIYDDNFKLTAIKDFTISYQNKEINREVTDKTLIDIARRIANKYGVEIHNFYINPTGKFLIGGFEGDAGLTGRKIVVDAYQSFANVGGGCMNGKDPSKVDLSGAYIAREIAKDLLIKHQLKWCEVQVSYAIGLKQPLAIYITSNKGEIEPTSDLYSRCEPLNIINELSLLKPNYEERAKFGHFR